MAVSGGGRAGLEGLANDTEAGLAGDQPQEDITVLEPDALTRLRSGKPLE